MPRWHLQLSQVEVPFHWSIQKLSLPSEDSIIRSVDTIVGMYSQARVFVVYGKHVVAWKEIVAPAT